MTAQPEGIRAAEYRNRLNHVREALRAVDLAGLVAFGDCWRRSNGAEQSLMIPAVVAVRGRRPPVL